MVLLLGVFAALSFRDAWCYGRSGNAKDVTLQLPDNVKLKIHDVMRKGILGGNIILGALVVGALVTVLESVCTGQVYVPTLVLVAKSGQSGTKALGYLLLYNLMFMLPLVIVFILTYFGLKTATLLNWSKQNVVFSKVLMGAFFVAMTVLIALL